MRLSLYESGWLSQRFRARQVRAAQLRGIRIVERAKARRPDVATERAARQLVLRPVVVAAVGAGDLHTVVTEEVVGEAEARSQLLAPAEVDGRFLDVRTERRDIFALDPNAQIERQAGVDRPVVLREQAQDVRAGLADRADIVDRVVAVGARCRSPRQGRRSMNVVFQKTLT